MGDLNIDLAAHSNKYTLQFQNILLSLGLRSSITKATRITSDSESVIDHIITNVNYSSIESGIIEYHISDHLPVFSVVNVKVTKIHQHCTPCTRRFFSVSKRTEFLDILSENLNKVNFSDSVHPNSKLDSLIEVLQESIDTVFPLRKLSRKQQKELRNPWVTPSIVKSTKKCKLLFKKFLKEKSKTSQTVFKKYRNQLNRVIEAAKDMHDFNEFQKVENDIKKTWKLINKKSGRVNAKTNLPSNLKSSEGNLVSNPKAVANHLNRHFVEKGVNLAKKITNSSNSFSSFSSPRNGSTFVFKKILVHEILKILKALSAYKSTGHDGIPAVIIKWASDIIAPLLTIIFNEFAEIGEYPSAFKIARITVLPKSGDPIEPDNYRPISVLSQLNKIFEKLIHERMVTFIDNFDYITPSQFGFRKGHSTSHAITHLNEQIIKNLEKKKLTAVLFIDLKAAFDTVNHDILLKNLSIWVFEISCLAYWHPICLAENNISEMVI